MRIFSIRVMAYTLRSQKIRSWRLSIHSRKSWLKKWRKKKKNKKSSGKQLRRGHDFGTRSEWENKNSEHMKSLSNVCSFSFLSFFSSVLSFRLVNLWTVIWVEMVFRILELNACVTYVGNLVFVRKACCRHFTVPLATSTRHERLRERGKASESNV